MTRRFAVRSVRSTRDRPTRLTVRLNCDFRRFFSEPSKRTKAWSRARHLESTDRETQEGFTRFVKRIREDVFESLLRAPSWLLRPSQPDHSAGLELTDSAVGLIRRYVLAKVVALGRALLAYQLRGTTTPEWAETFADCDYTWSTGVMAGLPWLCRSEGSERFLWDQSDLVGWGPGSFDPIRIYLPSELILRESGSHPSLDDVLTFVAPQLLERELAGERVPYFSTAPFITRSGCVRTTGVSLQSNADTSRKVSCAVGDASLPSQYWSTCETRSSRT